MDYNSPSPDNQHGFIFLKDSSLWITGTLTADADFGDFHVNANYNSHAFIARYSDTAYLTPYIFTDPHVGLNYQTTQQRCRIFPNPTSGILHITTNDEKITSVCAVSPLGQLLNLSLKGNTVSLDEFPSGIYTLKVITDKNVYQPKIIKL